MKNDIYIYYIVFYIYYIRLDFKTVFKYLQLYVSNVTMSYFKFDLITSFFICMCTRRWTPEF